MSSYLAVFFIIGTKASIALIGVALTLVVTNVLSLESSGLFLLCYAVVQVGGACITLGARNYLIKKQSSSAVSRWGRINNDVSFMLLFMLFIAFSAGAVIYAFFQLFSATFPSADLVSSIIPFLAFGVFCLGVLQVISAVFQGLQRSIMASILQQFIAPALFITFALIYQVMIGSISFLQLVKVYSVCLGLAAFLSIVVWLSQPKSRLHFAVRMSESMKVSFFSLFIILVMQQVTLWGGQLVAGYYLTLDDVATLAIVQRLSGVMSFILVANNMVFAPKYSFAFSSGEYSELNRLSLTSGRLMLLLALTSLGALFFFREQFLTLFNLDIANAEMLFIIVLVGQFVNVITGSSGCLLTMTNNERSLQKIVIFVGVTTLPLTILSTVLWGATGTAISIAFSTMLQSILATNQVKKQLGFSPVNVFRSVESNEVR